MYLIAIVSFLIGVILSGLVTYIVLSKKALAKTKKRTSPILITYIYIGVMELKLFTSYY